MTDTTIINELRAAAGLSGNDELIGMFQAFRPDGVPPEVEFSAVSGGERFAQRLQLLYQATHNSRRVDGLKDAYFVVRNPPMLHAEHAEAHALDFLTRLRELLAAAANSESIRNLFDPLPRVRILEGKPPKHPREKDERVALLDCIQDVIPAMVEAAFEPESLGTNLSEPLYFTACDALLRDFLRWPLLADHALGDDPFQPYFQLWKHGIKYRVFRNDQVDFYLPRRSTGELLDAGQFAGQD